jgi:acetyltransferase
MAAGAKRESTVSDHPRTSMPQARNYPRECERRVSTRDGTEYFIRPIVPEDAEREIAFVRSLSTESRYKRLMYSLREPSKAMIEPYVNVDYDRQMALIALRDVPGHEQIIGVARYARDDGGGAHEFAIVVTDQWQGRGVGTRLLEELLEYARAHGVRRLYGQVLHNNAPMLRLARKLGFSSGTCPDDPRLVTVTLELDASRRLRCASAQEALRNDD